MKKTWLSGLAFIFSMFILAGCQQEPYYPMTYYSVGEAVAFDQKEIVVAEALVTEIDGDEAIKFPITVRNLLSEGLNIATMYWGVYSPAGQYLTLVSEFLQDTDLYVTGYLPVGETFETFIAVLFSGIGDYRLEFGNYYEGLASITVPVE